MALEPLKLVPPEIIATGLILRKYKRYRPSEQELMENKGTKYTNDHGITIKTEEMLNVGELSAKIARDKNIAVVFMNSKEDFDNVMENSGGIYTLVGKMSSGIELKKKEKLEWKVLERAYSDMTDKTTRMVIDMAMDKLGIEVEKKGD